MILKILKTVMLLGTDPVEKAKEVTQMLLTPFTYIAWLIVVFLLLDLYFLLFQGDQHSTDSGTNRSLRTDMVYTAVESLWYAFASLIWIPIIDACRSKITVGVMVLLELKPRGNISIVDVATLTLVLSLCFDVCFYVNGSLLFLVGNWVSHKYVKVSATDRVISKKGDEHIERFEQMCENIYNIGLSGKVPNYKIRTRFYRLLDQCSEGFKSEALDIMPVEVEVKTDLGTEGNESQRPLVKIYDDIGNVRVLNDKDIHKCMVQPLGEWDLVDNNALHGNSIVTCKYNRSKDAQTYMVESKRAIFIVTSCGEPGE